MTKNPISSIDGSLIVMGTITSGLENGIKINVALSKFSPIGVDTMEDYIALKKIFRCLLKKLGTNRIFIIQKDYYEI